MHDEMGTKDVGDKEPSANNSTSISFASIQEQGVPVLEPEPALIAAQLAAALTKLADAEKERDFLRRRYTEVDAFADGARRELTTLRESEAIARSQAADGVALVRDTFEGRLTLLELELARVRREKEIMIAQASATDDGVRGRAAEADEARADAERWRIRAERAEREVARLREALEGAADGEYEEDRRRKAPKVEGEPIGQGVQQA
jgi:hypothetical protein